MLAVIAALTDAKLTPAELAAGFASFQGVRRRMEVRATIDGVAVVDDFAHHPTAVAVTLAGARTRWPKARIWAAFEPRSATSRRNVFQKEYVDAFAGADRVLIGTHARLAEIPEAERFDPAGLCAQLRQRGVQADFVPEVDAMAQLVGREAKPCDVVMILSNGDFGGLHELTLAALRKREKA